MSEKSGKLKSIVLCDVVGYTSTVKTSESRCNDNRLSC